MKWNHLNSLMLIIKLVIKWGNCLVSESKENDFLKTMCKGLDISVIHVKYWNWSASFGVWESWANCLDSTIKSQAVSS